MKKAESLLKEITDLTNKIRDSYPELYGFLEEDTLTLPTTNQPEVDETSLQNYLESLKELVKNYLETHKNLS